MLSKLVRDRLQVTCATSMTTHKVDRRPAELVGDSASDGAVGRVGTKCGVPNGIRTRVLALKGPRPGPLDDGDRRGDPTNPIMRMGRTLAAQIGLRRSDTIDESAHRLMNGRQQHRAGGSGDVGQVLPEVVGEYGVGGAQIR